MVLEIQKSSNEVLIDSLIDEAKNSLAYFFDHFDTASMSGLMDHLLLHDSTLFLTGVGKSGIIAKKIAMTLSASGTRALFLSPMDALHGDLGFVQEDATVLLFSKSGESDELISLCPALRNKKAYLIAVVSNEKNRLSKACDMQIVLPVLRELCPFNMVPTTSTLVQLLFGELLTGALMRAKKVTLEEFATNHPAGRIGKRLTFRVRDVMVQGDAIPFAHGSEVLINALSEFSSKKCGCLVIVGSEKKLVGIFTDGDLRRSLQKYGAQVLHKKLDELMTANPRSIDSKTLAWDAMKMMEADQKRPVAILPVVDEGKVVGLLKMHDIVQSGI